MNKKIIQANTKFTKEELIAKRIIKHIRVNVLNLNMKDASTLLNIGIKNLEDLEATRNYGCHIQWNHIVNVCIAYEIPLTTFQDAVLPPALFVPSV